VNGIIIVDKREGVTSHSVVSEIRKIFPNTKAGHSGTLDPMATGVLPVCLGKATRIAEYLIELPKTYRAAVTLGKTTDTGDATGDITAEKAVPHLARKEIEELLIKKFQGTIEQCVPIYSAVKHRGKPFYFWTRRGEKVPDRKRPVEIYSISLLELDNKHAPHLILDVKCSKGTYIRTLAEDIGKEIGCGGYLSSLVRCSVGPYELKEAMKIEEIKAKAKTSSGCTDFMKSMDTALMNLPKLNLDDLQVNSLKQGRIVFLDEPDMIKDVEELSPVRIYDQCGRFKAIACPVSKEGINGLKTVKYLAE
jgi:tRNA pseudouridine55 synthase